MSTTPMPVVRLSPLDAAQQALDYTRRQLFPAMLASDDVFDLEWMKRIVRLAKAAILAAIACPLPDEAPGAFVDHAALPARLSCRRAFAWRIAINSPACT